LRQKTAPGDRRVKRIVLAAVLFLTGHVGLLDAQTLEIVPRRLMMDESAVIRVTGLQPTEQVVIAASLVDGAGQSWKSEAEFLADAQGVVDLSRQAPLKGSYKGQSAMGMIWSMMPVTKGVGSYEAPRFLAPQTIEFQVLRQGQEIARGQMEQIAVAETVRQIRVQGQLHGTFFVPGGEGRYPGALVVGGSEGGVPLRRAAWLASHGFAALALAYFRYEDLPPDLEAIPLEYFGGALDWMAQRPEILPDRIGVVGTSRGGELALQLGSMYSRIKAVVAYVPADVRYPACCGNTRVPYAWTWQGQPLAYASLRAGNDPRARSDAAIAVEHSHGPMPLIGAEDDGVWRSASMVDAVAGRLHRTHFPYTVEVLKYPHAGHRAGRPEIVPAWHGSTIHPVSGRVMDVGGSPAGDAESSIDAIPKVLTFLRNNLGDGTVPGRGEGR
jgi:dienelactone hydrolase